MAIGRLPTEQATQWLGRITEALHHTADVRVVGVSGHWQQVILKDRRTGEEISVDVRIKSAKGLHF